MGGAGPRDHPRELGVGHRRGRGGQTGDEEGDQHGRTDARVVRVSVRHQPGEGEDPDEDDDPVPDRGQLPQAEALGKRAYSALTLYPLDLIDRHAPKDRLPCRSAHGSFLRVGVVPR